MDFRLDWLRIVRHLTQHVVPSLIVLAVIIELTDLPERLPAYSHFVTVGFSVLSMVTIALCGWIVFLWDIDRLFFRLYNKIDAQLSGQGATQEGNASLLNRAREMLNTKYSTSELGQSLRSRRPTGRISMRAGCSHFHGRISPRPWSTSTGVAEILLAPFRTHFVAAALPVGSAPASIISRMVFRYVAPEVKVRLYRRLVLRFLMQFGALFVLTALCFYLSIRAWSRTSVSVFNQAAVSPASVMLYQLDLMLRGALFILWSTRNGRSLRSGSIKRPPHSCTTHFSFACSSPSTCSLRSSELSFCNPAVAGAPAIAVAIDAGIMGSG